MSLLAALHPARPGGLPHRWGLVGSLVILLQVAGCGAFNRQVAEPAPPPEEPALAAVLAKADCPDGTVTRLSRAYRAGIDPGLLSFEGCGRSETYAYGVDGVAFVIDGPVQLSVDERFVDVRLGCRSSDVFAYEGFRLPFWIYAWETVLRGAELPSGWYYPWEVPSVPEGLVLAEELKRVLQVADIANELIYLRFSLNLNDVQVRWLPDIDVMCIRIMAPNGEPILYECVNMAAESPEFDLALCGAAPSPHLLPRFIVQ